MPVGCPARRLAALRDIFVVDGGFSVPGPAFGGLSAGMPKLDSGNRSLLAYEVGNRPEAVDLRVRPKTEIAMRSSSLGFHRGRFGVDQPCTTQGKSPKMDPVPVVGLSIHGAILAHG